MPHKLGAVVIGYHSTPDLFQFMKAWDAYNDIDAELELVLVECTQAEWEHSNSLWGDSVALTRFEDNLGYGKACNIGIGMYVDGCWTTNETPDTYAVFNADVEIRPGVLKHCVELLWSDDSYAVVGPRSVDRAGLITHAGIFGPDDHPKHRAFKVPGTETAFTDIRTDALMVSGAALFVKAGIWDELAFCPRTEYCGGAMLQTRHYFEDTWICYHARGHGYNVVYDGGATLVHQQGGATPDYNWAAQTMKLSREVYRDACRKHGIVCE